MFPGDSNDPPSLGDLKYKFIQARPPKTASDPWHSPYMLLGGALFSMGCANTDENRSLDTVMFDIDPGTWDEVYDQVRTFKIDPASTPWIPIWYASYMLTNALFRISAAAEKICYLCGADSKGGRPALWKVIAKADSVLNRNLPALSGYLGKMPGTWIERAEQLRKMREHYQNSGKVEAPLMHVIIQADTDKHVPYRPVKEIGFEWELAIGGFVEALDLWKQAVEAHEAGKIKP